MICFFCILMGCLLEMSRSSERSLRFSCMSSAQLHDWLPIATSDELCCGLRCSV